MRLSKVTLLVTLVLSLLACGTAAGTLSDTPDEPTPTDSGVPDVPEVVVDASDDVVDVVDSGPDSPVDAGPLPCGSDAGTRCSNWHHCDSNDDCESKVCAYNHVCAPRKSCAGGKGADSDRCDSITVPGGSFTNSDFDGAKFVYYPASVPSFQMDRYEVTVGRFRAFVESLDGNLRANAPSPGDGAKKTAPGSGWRQSFNARLPLNRQEVNDRLTWGCAVGGNNNDYGAATWTAAPGPNEEKPLNCVDWYTILDFCVWDGGRLPTDAEWSFVGISGDENRLYPFGNVTPTYELQDLVIVSRLPTSMVPGSFLFTQGPEFRGATDGPLPLAPVGLKSERSKWGHADLTGNIIELTMDEARPLPTSCSDCSSVSWPNPPQTSGYPLDWKLPGDEFSDAAAANDGTRLARGSSWQGEPGGHWIANGRNRFWLPVWRTYSAAGGRCVRDL